MCRASTSTASGSPRHSSAQASGATPRAAVASWGLRSFARLVASAGADAQRSGLQRKPIESRFAAVDSHRLRVRLSHTLRNRDHLSITGEYVIRQSPPPSIRGSLILLGCTAILIPGRAIMDYRSAPEPGTATVFWTSLAAVLVILTMSGFAINRRRAWGRTMLTVIAGAGWLALVPLMSGSGLPLRLADVTILILASAACALTWTPRAREWLDLNRPPNSALPQT